MPSRFVCLLALSLLFTACERYDPRAGLSEPELQAVDKITTDQWVVLRRTDRDRDGHLIVWTHQGEERVRYRVIVEPEATDDQTPYRIERMGDHPVIHGGGHAGDTGGLDQRRFD